MQAPTIASYCSSFKFFFFNNLVFFPCLGFVFCVIGEGVGGHRIRLSEKIWSVVMLWNVFLVFFNMHFCVFYGRFCQSGQIVREEP